MSCMRDFIMFLVGFQTFHMLSHVYMWWASMLPMQTPFFELTDSLNMAAIVFNGLTVVALMWYAKNSCSKCG